jgi:ribosomal protein L37AE/L43A
MKPRIRLVRGIWVCRSSFLSVRVVGDGYTPKEAYAEWLRELKRSV